MAIGDDAAAAGMDLVLGSQAANTIDTEINKSRDYIAQKTSDVTPVAKGGTGATNASGARSNLGAAAVGHKHAASDITSGTFGQNRLAANSVGNAQIQDAAVSGPQIAPGSVSATKIADGAIHWAHIVDAAITGSKLAPDAVTGSKIADGAVHTEHVVDGAITNPKMANGSVGPATLADSCVTNAKIVNGAVGTGSIANNAVTRAKIANNAVDTAQINPGAIIYASLHADLSERLEDGHWTTDVKTDESFWTSGATPVTSAYVSAWINGDGRIGKSASSLRYKKYVSAMDPAAMGDIWPDLQRFQMRGGDGSWRYGYIAEYMAAVPDQERFVVYESEKNDDGDIVPKLDADGNPIPESIDFFGMLIAQVAQLQQRVTELEGRS